jgi:hypothetical protein
MGLSIPNARCIHSRMTNTALRMAPPLFVHAPGDAAIDFCCKSLWVHEAVPLLNATRCQCGDGSCMLCDDNGYVHEDDARTEPECSQCGAPESFGCACPSPAERRDAEAASVADYERGEGCGR